MAGADNEKPSPTDYSPHWWELDKQIRAWDEKRRWYSRGLPMLIIMLGIMWPGLAYIADGFSFPFYAGMGALALMIVFACTAYFQSGFQCPICRRKLKNIAEILILKNFRQCPWCETSFRNTDTDT